MKSAFLFKCLLVIGVLSAGVLLVAPAFSAPMGVRKTTHNLSVEGYATNTSWAGYYSETVETQICIFCHTPHGGDTTGPLWNRAIPAGFDTGWTHYNSVTLSSGVGAANRAVSPESLLCLSCHDGTIAVGDLINQSALGTPSTSTTTVVNLSSFNPRVGNAKDLSDDHPISFSYTDSVTAVGTGYGNLETIEHARDVQGLKFYGATNRVECGTCHDPHVNYDPWYDPDQDPAICNAQRAVGDLAQVCDSTADIRYFPFLRIPNDASNLCLSCHNK